MLNVYCVDWYLMLYYLIYCINNNPLKKSLSFSASKHRVGGPAAEDDANDQVLPATIDLEVVVRKSISQAIDEIINHNLRNSESSRLGAEVISVARHVKEEIACDKFSTVELEKKFVELFQRLGLPVYAQEREALFTTFHQLRWDRNLRTAFLSQLNTTVNKAALGFYQQLLRETLGFIFAEANASITRASTESQQTLSATEQNVLFYVTGYMARKVATCKLCTPAVKAACTSGGSSDELGFVSEYSAWTATVSRGGLINPSQNFYLLIRTLDRVHCQRLNLDSMTSHSLNRCIITEVMMSDISVKHHWNAIVKESAADQDLALRLLEYIICVFVTVKGFAVARYLRGRLNTDSKTSTKSTSLRHSLHWNGFFNVWNLLHFGQCQSSIANEILWNKLQWNVNQIQWFPLRNYL